MSGAGFRSVALAVAWRNVHNFFTNPALILPALVFPLFFFTAFAGGLSNVANVPGFSFPDGYTAFQFVFVLLQASAFAGVFTGFAVARDFESGFSRRILLAAPNRGGIVAGYVLAAMTRMVFTYVVITVVALVVGMKVGGDGVDLFGLYGLAILVNVAATLWSTGVAMRLRTMQAGPAMQMPVFLVLFVAPVWLPLPLLGGWVHAVAQVNPTTVLLESGRGFISGDPVKAGLAFAIVAGLVLVFSFWARGGLRSAESAA
jgi:ABC-type multidrug transport system permease subunit